LRHRSFDNAIPGIGSIVIWQGVRFRFLNDCHHNVEAAIDIGTEIDAALKQTEYRLPWLEWLQLGRSSARLVRWKNDHRHLAGVRESAPKPVG
jgi:hypothetical protein